VPGEREPHPTDAATAGRLFLGIELPEQLREELLDLLRGAARVAPLPGRPVAPQNWHITLRFLGETAAPRAALLRHALGSADLGGRFVLGLGGWGAFPRPARAAVTWLGISAGAEQLARLAGACEEAARVAGFTAERRPFHAHLTLSRVQPPRDARGVLGSLPPFAGSFEVAAATLFRSHLGAGPPRYETVERFPLG
jgi:RNA 2',3'-cyclic 3'-phosphodiesterase